MSGKVCPQGPGEDTRTVTGEDARRRLAEVNDAQFLSPGQGVVRVTEERWRTAQRFERTGWIARYNAASRRIFKAISGSSIAAVAS